MTAWQTVRQSVALARETIARYDSANPHTAGQVRRAVGGVLVADGLVGLEPPTGGKKSRPGLAGALGGILFGIAFVAVGLFTAGLGPDTDTSTTGTVVAVDEFETDDGRVCRLTAVFSVDGQEYRAGSTGRSSTNCSKVVGGSVRVDYLAADPTQSTTADPASAWFPWVFVAAGAVMSLSSLGTALLRGASIVVGMRMVSAGNRMVRDRPGTPEDAGIAEEARRVVADAVLRLRRDGGVLGGRLRRHGPAEPAPAAATPATWAGPAAPAGPMIAPSEPVIAPGWYLTADGRHHRWHDGSTWTSHVRPVRVPG